MLEAICLSHFAQLPFDKLLVQELVVAELEKMLEWENAGSLKLLSVGYSLRPPELLFRKIEDSEVQYQVEKLKQGLEKSKIEQKAIKAALVPVSLDWLCDSYMYQPSCRAHQLQA